MGHRDIHRRQIGSTRATGVCWSMTSETRTPQGEVPCPRQGRSLASWAYQSRIGWCRDELGTFSLPGSDVTLENARLSQAGQALANGTGTTFADAFDRHQIFKICGEQLL